MDAGQSSQKQYGLIKPAKKAPPTAARPSVFNNDSSSDEDSAPTATWSKAALKSISHGSVQAAQTRKVIRQAMQEDASLFQYDEVYDDMQQQKQNKAETKKTADKKPRYMQKLLESAEQRRRQQERRVERQVQQERDQEGDEFADKEQFVTEAYRQRLIQRKQEEEQERRIKHIEELNDVTKQKDLGSFYRHMYHRSTSGAEPDVKAEPGEPVVKPEPESEPDSDPEQGPGVVPPPVTGAAPSARQYRSRRASSSPEPDPAGGAGTRDHQDRDRERSRSRDPERELARGAAEPAGRRRSRSDADSDSEADSSSGEEPAPERPPQQPARPRASSAEREARRRALYDKRTVGEALEAARRRYFERRAARANGQCPVPLEA